MSIFNGNACQFLALIRGNACGILTNMLESIHSPDDLRALAPASLPDLASDIRNTLIRTVKNHGGHLASNLGAVELTLAVHRVLHSPKDAILFDTGHQTYTHKLITGRDTLPQTLRCQDGVTGFPNRMESIHDRFEVGHASTAISAALGIARARDLQKEDFTVLAVVGDGALTGGMAYEALNDAGSNPTQMIVLLNDNELSIAHNTSALAKHLTRLRGSRKYVGTKRAVKSGLMRVPVIGQGLANLLECIKIAVRRVLVPGDFFESMGFVYLGPVNGHDIPTLERVIADARDMRVPVVIHAVTQKGRGYAPSERAPEKYHGVAPPMDDETHAIGENGNASSETIGKTLIALGATDPRTVAITAAMPQGTGLSPFEKIYPNRTFDVGIAEEHAVTLAAGFASQGMKPYVAIYASFAQRAVDQMLSDVCLQGLPVTLLLDRAGFVPGDGQTHQGVYDIPLWRAMPGITLWQPADCAELAHMVQAAGQCTGPLVIRYPKRLPEQLPGAIATGQWRQIHDGKDAVLVGYGQSIETALVSRAQLLAEGISCAVYSATCLPIPEEAMVMLMDAHTVYVLEHHVRAGGLGEAVLAAGIPCTIIAVEGIVPRSLSMQGLLSETGLTVERVVEQVRNGR